MNKLIFPSVILSLVLSGCDPPPDSPTQTTAPQAKPLDGGDWLGNAADEHRADLTVKYQTSCKTTKDAYYNMLVTNDERYIADLTIELNKTMAMGMNES